MSHQISAHVPDKQARDGYRESPALASIEESAWSGGIHVLYDRLGCADLDAGVSGAGAVRRVTRKVIDAALRLYCQEFLDGEAVAAEVAFLAGCVAGWPGKEKSIPICFA